MALTPQQIQALQQAAGATGNTGASAVPANNFSAMVAAKRGTTAPATPAPDPILNAVTKYSPTALLPKSGATNAINNFGAGVIKSFPTAIHGLGTAIEGGLDQTLGRVGNAIEGNGFTPSTVAQQETNSFDPSGVLQNQNHAQNVGGVVGNTAQFFLAPEADVGKLPEAASMLAKVGNAASRVGQGALKDAVIGTGQTGSLGEGALFGLGSGALRGAGEALGAGAKAFVGPRSSAEVSAKNTQAFEDLFNSTKPLQKFFDQSSADGHSPAAFLGSDSSFTPEVRNGRVNTNNAIANITQHINPAAQAVRGVIDSSGVSIPLKVLQKNAIAGLDALKDEGAVYNRAVQAVKNDFASYAATHANEDGLLPLSAIDDIKKAKYNNINWATEDRATPSADYAIANSARKAIETNLPDSPIKTMNEELGHYLNARSALQALNGATVKGGKLNKYFAGTVGTVIGSHAGPLGAILGGISAEGAAELLQRSTFDGNPLFNGFREILQKERPGILRKAEEIIARNKAGRLLPEGPEGGYPVSDTPITALPQGNPGQFEYTGQGMASQPARSTISTSATGTTIPQSISDIPQDIAPSAGTAQSTPVNNSMRGVSTIGRIPADIPKELQPLAKEAAKYKSADEFIDGVKSENSDYGMSHRPTEGPQAFDLTQQVDGEDMVPKDMYTQWYGSRGTEADKESIAALKAIKGKPNADLTIYRAGPKSDINNGDWVTLSKKYAEEHAEGNGTTVSSYNVKARDLRWAVDDVNEFGYYPSDETLTGLYNKVHGGSNPITRGFSAAGTIGTVAALGGAAALAPAVVKNLGSRDQAILNDIDASQAEQDKQNFENTHDPADQITPAIQTALDGKPDQETDNLPKGVTGTSTPLSPSPRLQTAIEGVQSTSGIQKGIIPAVLQMESSMGTDDTNKNPKLGAYAWLTGLTPTAKKDLKNAGITADYTTREGALRATADFWQLLEKRYPKATPEEIYFDHYYAGPNDSAARRKLFTDSLATYSK